jgi:hypothetical protein
MGKRLVSPDADAFQKAHFTVIKQLHLVTPLANEHKRQLREDNPNRGRAWLAKMHMQGFSRWLRDYVEICSNNVVISDEIRNLAVGPLFTVTRYDDDDTETDTYHGQIEEIWELDYVGLKVALFWCRWVTNGKRAVSKDKYGYFSVDLRDFG